MKKPPSKTGKEVREYVDAVTMHKNTPSIIDFQGNEFRIVKGKIITQEQFLTQYPIPYLWEGRGFAANPDRTKNVFIDKKAY